MKKKLKVLLFPIICTILYFPVTASAAVDSELPIVEESAETTYIQPQDIVSPEGSDYVGTDLETKPETSESSVAIDEVHFPDSELRDYIKDCFDKDSDSILSQEELSAATSLWFQPPFDDSRVYSIRDFTGIEYLTSLTTIIMECNYIVTHLDVSKVPTLTSLDITSTHITELNLSKNSNLTELIIGPDTEKVIFPIENNLKHLSINALSEESKDITFLDFSTMTHLETLYCDSGIAFNNFDFSKFPSLKKLDADGTIKGLDLSNLPLLENLDIGTLEDVDMLDFTSTPFINSIRIFSENIEKINLANAASLEYLQLYTRSLNSLNLSGCTALKSLYLNAKITDFLDLDTTQLTEGSINQSGVLKINSKGYYNLASLPGFHKDRVRSVSGASLSGSKLYPNTTKVSLKYYLDDTNMVYSTYTFDVTNTPTPAKVKGLTVTKKTSSSLTCRWNKIKGVDGYRLYARTGGKLAKYVTLKKDSSTSATLKGLKNGTVYTLIVKAYKKSGGRTYLSTYELEDAIETPTLPLKPTLKLKSAGTSKVTLSWNKVTLKTNNDGYLLYYKTSKNGKYTRLAKLNDWQNSYTVENLKKGKTYYFKIRAFMLTTPKPSSKLFSEKTFSSTSNVVSKTIK